MAISLEKLAPLLKLLGSEKYGTVSELEGSLNGDFLTGLDSISSIATPYLDNAFQVETSEDSQKLKSVVNSISPLAGLLYTGGEKIFSSKLNKDYMNLQNTNSINSSYLGSAQNINNLNRVKRISTGLKKEKQTEADELTNQFARMNTINDIAKDQQLAFSNRNIQQYQNRINGNNFNILRSAKGGVLTQKIDFIKSKKLSQVINLETQKVEQFKNGGSFIPILTYDNPIEDNLFKDGGKIKETLKTEETTQKNVIPEGALHKNKHHMENAEGLTKKGIPVVDNDNEQQAEVEKEELILNFENTQYIEERYHKYFSDDLTQKEKDELAMEVGDLLVDQILNNTDDRADLIAKCKEGGKL